MNYSKEILWHFTCEFCKGWWSVAASDKWHPKDAPVVVCPHCGKHQKSDEDIGYTGVMRWIMTLLEYMIMENNGQIQ